jgi:hypothetical protein
LTVTGTVYASAGSFTGNISAGSGNIGNWNIVAGEIAYGTDIVLDATNKRISLNNAAIVFGYDAGGAGNHGIYLDANNYWYSTGAFKVYADANNYIDFDGSTVDINSTNFELSATNIAISSADKRITAGTSNTIVILDGDEGLWSGNSSFASAPFSVDLNGNLTASNANIGGTITSTVGAIGGWNIAPGKLSSNTVRLQSSGSAGLYIQDAYSQDLITVASKSMYTIGSATDECGNDSFEEDPSSIWQTSGYHIGNSTSPLTVPSWSLATTGPISHSITKRSGSVTFGQFNQALVGDFTYDIVYPGQFAPSAALSRSRAEVSQSYLNSTNTYEITQIVSASSNPSEQWTAGNVVSLAFVGKMSHSLSGIGYDRGLNQQKYRVDYWDTDTSQWVGFIPARSGSQPYGKYSMGTRWTSIKSASSLPKTTHKLKITLSGSLNTPALKASSEPLYSEWFADKITQLLSGAASLTGDTLIRMSDNTEKSVSDLIVGDKILSYNIATHAFTTSSVEYKKKRYANSFYEINGDVHATKTHPFYVSGSGWIHAEDLNVGDLLFYRDETYRAIESIEIKEFGAHVYNMSLLGNSTYFANDILNHNAAADWDISQEAFEVYTETVVGGAKYPYTELSFDNFRLIQDQPRIEMSSDGFLLYQSEISYLKMTPNTFLMRTPTDAGLGVGNAVTSNMATTNTGVFGQLAAPSLQPYEAEPADIGTTPFAGGTDEYSRGNHRHDLTFSTLDTVLGQGTVTSLNVANLTFSGSSFEVSGALHVSSSDDSYFIGGGEVGIGLTNPSAVVSSQISSQVSSDNKYAFHALNSDGESAGGFYITGKDGTMYLKSDGGVTTTRLHSDGVSYLNGGNVGIGTTNPLHKLHVITDATATAQDLTNIDRTSGNLIRFTNPQYSVNASMGLLLRVFPDSDLRQGSGILATGGSNNAITDLDLIVSKDGGGATTSTTYSALKILGNSGYIGIGTTLPQTPLHV